MKPFAFALAGIKHKFKGLGKHRDHVTPVTPAKY